VRGCTRITEARNGNDAWEEIQEDSPDLALIDWEMESGNGLDLIKRIRNDPSSADAFLPIIMVSAYSERARIVAARDSGINEFVMKPVSAKALFSRLNAVIEHPRRFVRAGDYFGPDRRRRDKFVPQDRRQEKGEEPEAIDAADIKAVGKVEMSQDEVNTFMNPEDEQTESAAEK
jgi:two-component system chemotaxis response regulator CheY